MFRFSTDVVKPREGLEFLNDFLAQALAPFRTEPAGDHPFRAEASMRLIGELPLIWTEGAGYRGARRGAEIARSADHFYVASVHVGGATSLGCRGEERDLKHGDVFILDTMHEIEFGLERPYRHLLVKLPKQWIDARVPRPDRLCGTVLSHDNALARLFASYVAAGFLASDELSPTAATLFAQHAIDLLVEAAAETEEDQPAPSEAWRAAMFVRASRLIELKFSDPDLRPATIAEELGISARMLHRIFAGHDETVMRRLLKERLKRAAKLLASPRARNRSITEIAFACGFNDLSHFGRSFAAGMGMSPSQWRKQKL